ncbi:MAG: ATP-dependent zinc metalloprotease FtsH [Thermodesulfovibrionales bacterium]|jgi:cell division protease FtsH
MEQGQWKERLKTPQSRLLIAAIAVSAILFFSQFLQPGPPPQVHSLSYSRFLDQVEGGNVRSVSIQGTKVSGELKEELPAAEQGKMVKVRAFFTQLPAFQGEELIRKLREKAVAITVEPPAEGSVFWQIVLSFLPWIIFIGIWVLIARKSRQMAGGPDGLFSFGQSKAKLYDMTRPRITFDDVAGMENTKKEMAEIIEFLKAPEQFTKIGAKVPKGVLLMGPPGTGKTLLARAAAGEAGVPFYSITGSEFVEMFVGVGAARVRDLFKKAKENKPSIIFIDEIDAVGRTRGTGLGGGNDEREQTLNQILSELDGFEPNESVIVMAATNRPDVLDPALLRPGRFDRHIVVDRPGWKERKEILKIHVRDKRMAEGIDLDTIAKGTPGMTGADIENLANEAALIALRKKKEVIDADDFEEARDKIYMGTVREETISDMERRITAIHEAGHALVARSLPGADPVHKVSIVPRGMAMGATQVFPEEDRHYYPKAYLLTRISVFLAGRVAEKLVFHDVSSGAQSDLKEATALAEKMVAQWGMSDTVGPINLGRGEEHPFLGRELSMPKRYSETMAWIMDQEIQRLMTEAESKAEEVLTEKKETLEAIAAALIENETLDREELDRLIGLSAK